jgi:hypothetical protein
MSMRVVCPEGHSVLVDASKLGGTAVCPRCLTAFLVEMPDALVRNARKEESKSRRARDDDDDDDEDGDDEEEERPRKKAKAKKPKDDDEEENERPRKKATAKKAKDDEDDEDEDEDDEPRTKKKSAKKEDDEDEEESDEEKEPEEVEEPIEWTPRKRQLKVASMGLIAMIVGCYSMMAVALFNSIWIDLYEFNVYAEALTLFHWISMPLLYLGLTAFVVGMVMSWWTPAKAEGRGALISALVFATIVYILGLLAGLTRLEVLLSDPARAKNFVQLLEVGSVVCLMISLASAMAYVSKLMIFMRLHLDASQAITNIGFIMLAYGMLLGLVFSSGMLRTGIGDWFRFVVVGGADFVCAYLMYMWLVVVFLLMKVRVTIDKYIRE